MLFQDVFEKGVDLGPDFLTRLVVAGGEAGREGEGCCRCLCVAGVVRFEGEDQGVTAVDCGARGYWRLTYLNSLWLLLLLLWRLLLLKLLLLLDLLKLEKLFQSHNLRLPNYLRHLWLLTIHPIHHSGCIESFQQEEN